MLTKLWDLIKSTIQFAYALGYSLGAKRRPEEKDEKFRKGAGVCAVCIVVFLFLKVASWIANILFNVLLGILPGTVPESGTVLGTIISWIIVIAVVFLFQLLVFGPIYYMVFHKKTPEEESKCAEEASEREAWEKEHKYELEWRERHRYW